MTKIIDTILIAISVAAIIIFSYWLGQQAYNWMPLQATAEAQRVDDLFSFLITLSSIVFLGVVGMIVYALITCRAKPNDYTEGHPSRGNVKLEILWTAIPTILVLWISWQSYNIYEQLDIEGLQQIVELPLPLETEAALAESESSTNQKPERIEVVAKQWGWTFHYPERNISSSELHLPLNRRVELALRSEDVIHGFYVPEFRFKQDIIPTRDINIFFRPILAGKYRLNDSQFSGAYFALMSADVYVEPIAKYNQWLDRAAKGELAIANNRANDEYTHPVHKILGSQWPTVAPADTNPG